MKKPTANDLENFLYLSLAITALRIFFSLLARTFDVMSPIFWSHLVAIALLLGQAYFLNHRNRAAWILSAIQVGVVVGTGRGTFGYILTYLWEPFKSHTWFPPTIATALMVTAEMAKTYFMYKRTSSAPALPSA
jgi:hypothetical protein